MKKLLSCLAMSTVVYVAMAQYTVTKVVGIVKNKTSGEALKTGSKLSDNDLLSFSSPNDMVRVIVAGKGIYIISPSSHQGSQQSEIVEMLRSTLHVKFREGYLSGRSASDESIPAALETQEMVNTKNLVKEVNKYVFDQNLYNTSKGRFFLQIDAPGKAAVIHPLHTTGDTLIIYAADVKAEMVTDPQNANYKLGYFSKEKGSSQSIATMHPYIDSTGEMESIIKLVIEENRAADAATLQQACYSEVYAALGRPSDIVFKEVFNDQLAKTLK
jgi:hypothetical protein